MVAVSLKEAIRTEPAGPALRRIEVVANAAAGSVGPGAADQARALIEAHGAEAQIASVQPDGIGAALEAAVARGPDLLVILAGDGTARTAATLCGPTDILMAPLAGGTMNVLPHALYGARDWKTALADILDDGVVRTVGGGEIDGHRFYVAAIVGAPALWAEAREAVRAGQLRQAIERAHYAWRNAFASRLHYRLDQGVRCSANALALVCPLISGVLDDETQLEAAALDPADSVQAFRLGFRALLSDVLGDWRNDPAVTDTAFRSGEAWARGHIPAILDGEPRRLPKRVQIRFNPAAFRALVPRAPKSEA